MIQDLSIRVGLVDFDRRLMRIVSYAQNREDILLRRALHDIDKGFYIDVGAHDPEKDSVTKTFYDSGWSGLNIEPQAKLMEKLARERPRDTNLRTLAGDGERTVDFFEIPQDDQLSTLDPEVAYGHAKLLGYSVKKSQVQMTTLSRICADNGVGEVHFLKIDAEGSEDAVLQGFDFQRWRPWILLIESTIPYSQVDSSFKWEHLVAHSNYKCAYFDGLSKFFVAQERADLVRHFNAPPNVFDTFISSGEHELERLKKSPRLLFQELCKSLRRKLPLAKIACRSWV